MVNLLPCETFGLEALADLQRHGTDHDSKPLPRMKKIARSLSQHRELILNYFRAQKLLSSGIVEGLNNKAKVTMRKSYGFRTFRVLELALYHSLGKLPEPESTHDFF